MLGATRENQTYFADVTIKVMAPDKDYAMALVQDSIQSVYDLYPEQVKVVSIELDKD